MRTITLFSLSALNRKNLKKGWIKKCLEGWSVFTDHKFWAVSPSSTGSPQIFVQELVKLIATYNYKLLSGLIVLSSFISVALFHCTYHIVPLIVVVGISCGALHCHSKHHPWQVRSSPHSPHCYSPLWSLRKHQSERYSYTSLLTTCLIMKKHGSRVDM